jgi:DNA-binding HxlR family transcriptional regulator
MTQIRARPDVRLISCLSFLAQEWMSHIVWTLGRHETIRFGALRRALPGSISARILSSRLKALEANGFVSRREVATTPLHVEYSLTEERRRLDAVLNQNEAFFRGSTISEAGRP